MLLTQARSYDEYELVEVVAGKWLVSTSVDLAIVTRWVDVFTLTDMTATLCFQEFDANSASESDLSSFPSPRHRKKSWLCPRWFDRADFTGVTSISLILIETSVVCGSSTMASMTSSVGSISPMTSPMESDESRTWIEPQVSRSENRLHDSLITIWLISFRWAADHSATSQESGNKMEQNRTHTHTRTHIHVWLIFGTLVTNVSGVMQLLLHQLASYQLVIANCSDSLALDL